jgi:hypothetical protein
LNESKEFRIFWAKWTIDNHMFPDTIVTALPAFAHNCFGIRHELAFKLCVCWVAVMTYISTMRLTDPSADSNPLLKNTFILTNTLYRSFVIALGVKYGAIAALLRFVWHTDDFCSVHERDATINIYEKWVCRIETLTNEDLCGTLIDLKVCQHPALLTEHIAITYCPIILLKELFGLDKACALQQFWDAGQLEREIVFKQANSTEYKPYVQHFLHASGLPTSEDIALRKRECPDTRCLDSAPIHNVKMESLFAHQAYAAQSTRAKHNRLRGMAMGKASATFACETKLRQDRRKRFLHAVQASKARMIDWVEKHQSDEGFLGLFNRKYISVQRRREIIERALSGWRDNVRISSLSLFPSLTLCIWHS